MDNNTIDLLVTPRLVIACTLYNLLTYRRCSLVIIESMYRQDDKQQQTISTYHMAIAQAPFIVLNGWAENGHATIVHIHI